MSVFDLIGNRIKIIKRGNIHVLDERSIAFGSGFFDGWRNTDSSTITIEADSVLGRVVKFNASTGTLYYYVNLDTNIFTKIRYTGWQLAGGGSYFFYVGYSDATNETWEDVASTTKTQFTKNLKADKTLTIIAVSKGLGSQADGYFGAPEIYDSESNRWISLTSSLGTVQAELLSALPAGTNNIGDVDVLTLPTITLPANGTITHFSKAATGDHLTPAAGKALKVWGFFYYADADIKTEVRFKTSGNVIGALATKGSCGMNLLTMASPQGAADEKIEIYLSGAGNAKGWTCTGEV